MSEKRSFFSELKRRNVFRVALTYAVVAWLLIELAAVFVPMLAAPQWIITPLVALLALGFALALVISWSFEMTPEGLKRTEDLSPDEVIPYWSRRKFATFVVGTAVIAFGLSAYQLLGPKPVAAPVQIATQQSHVVSRPENVADVRPAARVLREIDAQWSNAAAAKDLQQTIAYYSDDAIVLPPNAASATTRDAIRKLWKGLLASPGLVIAWNPARVEISDSGEMAYISGTYELTMNDAAGKPIHDRGKYLEVWKKQPDGNWKCSADMWNSDLAPSPAAPERK
jgi:ketosteroid isomerase-like protein